MYIKCLHELCVTEREKQNQKKREKLTKAEEKMIFIRYYKSLYLTYKFINFLNEIKFLILCCT
jgi:hypothetical protein